MQVRVMSTTNREADVRSANGRLRDRRMVMERRVSQGRRMMIRFDRTGGDRRSGYARRNTDDGFREQTEDD